MFLRDLISELYLRLRLDLSWNLYTKRWSKVGSAKKPKSSAVTLSSFRPKSSVMYLKVQSTHLLGPFKKKHGNIRYKFKQ